jgi:RimJ/RimL family protein N-acetyltransferase
MLFRPDNTLQTQRVLIRVLNLDDATAVSEQANDPSIWSHFTSNLAVNSEMIAWVAAAVSGFEQQSRVPWAIIDKATGVVIGSTSFGNIDLLHGRLEIGWTWLGRQFQGVGINREVKFLLLRFAFEALEIKRIEFKTDVLNQQSRRALKNIGATEEGVLRSHMIMPHNRRRDTIYYSILADEWPEVKANYFTGIT